MTAANASLIGGILMFIIGVWSLISSRRKIAAETQELAARKASEELDTSKKISDLLEEMQGQNVNLYKKNTELEKNNTDQARMIEVLTARLQSRDTQLEASTRQLDLLRNLAKDAPVIETLKTQLVAMNMIVAKLQDAQTETSKVLLEREKSYAELFKTNRNLELQKPGKTEP